MPTLTDIAEVKMHLALTRAMWGYTFTTGDEERTTSIQDMGYRDYLYGLYITLKYGYEEWCKWWQYQQDNPYDGGEEAF